MNKFLIDENLSPLVASYIRNLGYNAVSVRDVGLRSKPDEKIIQFAKSKSYIIVTQDVRFGAFFHFFSEYSPGIVVLSGKDGTTLEFQNILKYLDKEKVLNNPQLDSSLIIARLGKYRIRRKRNEN